MKEKEKIINDVFRIIDNYRDRRIILYGTGNVSRWIIEKCIFDKNYEISEIIDFNYSEEFFCGYKVITKENIEKSISDNDLIIVMNRNPVIAQFIYNRICHFIPKDSLVLWIDGSVLHKSDNNIFTKYNINNYSLDDIICKINSVDVVSFDVFDTLLVRNVANPSDVHLLMNNEMQINYNIYNFSELRQEAEIKANSIFIAPTLNEIYSVFCELYDIDTSYLEQFVKIEIETELKVLLLRNDIIKLLEYCVRTHKEIYIISDTYFSIEVLSKIFLKCGVDLRGMIDARHILLSCELRKSKENNEMWNYYSELTKGRKRLHFGDNEIYDIQVIKNRDIDSICTFSPRIIRQGLVKGPICNQYNELTSIELGIFDSFVFNSPFSDSEVINSHFNYGYAILGPVIFNYLYWILQQEIKYNESSNKKIYFFSRDGYFLVKLFNQMTSFFDVKTTGVYLYSSRSFLKYLCYKRGESEKTCFIGSIRDFMKYRFNYNIVVDDSNQEYIDSDDELDIVIEPYIDEIIHKQQKSRRLYYDYLNSIGINVGDDNITVVDPTYNGTCQYYLSKYANIKTHGYYCVANLSDDNKYNSDISQMKAFYQEQEDKKAINSILNKYTLVFESSIMVSPEGSVIDIDDSGFVFSPKGKTQDLFYLKEETYHGISKYFNDICNYIKNFNLFDQQPDSMLPQVIFSMCIEGKIEISDIIKQSLYADDYYNQITDYNVAWE